MLNSKKMFPIFAQNFKTKKQQLNCKNKKSGLENNFKIFIIQGN